MGHLFKAYNISFLQAFRNIYKCFSGEAGLKAELTELIDLVRADANTHEIYNRFCADTNAHMDALFSSDADCLEKIPMFVRMNLPSIYSRLMAEEQPFFWNSIFSVLKYGSMLSACGTQVSSMEDMAMKFVKDRPDLKPEEYHQTVLQEMLSGGDLSQQLLSSFKQPGTLQNILSNFGNLLRTPGQEPIDLSELTKMIKPSDLENLDSEFAALQQNVKDTGVNPFAQVQEMMRAETGGAGAAVAAASFGGSPLEQSLASTSGMASAVRKLAALAHEEKLKKDAAERAASLATKE